MPPSEFSRGRFLAIAAAFQAAMLPLEARAQATPPSPSSASQTLLAQLHRNRLGRRALVLSGGGARGAYQAGLIASWVAAGNIKDGEPLMPYGLVCGTSIGALNAYMVATGRYSALHNMWLTVASQEVVKLKGRYRYIVDPTSGVGNRIAQAIGLALGLKSNVKGVLDSGRVRNWLLQNMDPTAPVLMPVVWTVTNLSDQRPEFFYRIPTELTELERNTAIEAIKDTVGPDTAVREATADILIDSLQASASIPLAFDPVELPSPTGGTAQYVDGGVTANTPIGVARAFASNVDVVLMDPVFQPETYKNAMEIGIGVFGTMQQRILDSDVRAAVFETYGKQAFDALSASKVAQLTHGSAAEYAAFEGFLNSLYASTFYVKRPEKVLPVEVVGFNDEQGLAATFNVGYLAGSTPFAQYEVEEFSF
jgi:predicted acylesterase/phospholipase RssA